jgi:DNA-binding winged helix-turn-helix (wHTH) protein
MASVIGVVYEFGPFRLDSARRILAREGRHLTLPPKTFDLLILLIETRGRVLTKKELMSALWPDTFVEDANLSFQISALRKALGEEGTEWIETLPRYGYRFSGEVREVDPNPVSVVGVPLPHDEPAPARHGTATSTGGRTLVPWIAAALIAIAAVPLAVTHLRETRGSELPITFQVYPPERVSPPDSDSLAVSPNGGTTRVRRRRCGWRPPPVAA